MRLHLFHLLIALTLLFSVGCSGNSSNPLSPSGDTAKNPVTDDLRILAVDQNDPVNYWVTPLIVDGKFWASHYNENGTLHRAIGPGIDAPDPLDFIAKHIEIFQVKPENLDVLLDEYHSGIHYLIYEQTYNGIPVEKSRVDFRYSRNGKLVMIGSDVFPMINISTTPSLSENSAYQILVNDADETPSPELERAELVIYPVPETGTPAWKVEAGLWKYFIDARTGAIIERIQHRWNVDGTFSAHVENLVKMTSPYDPDMSIPSKYSKVWYRSNQNYPFTEYGYGFVDINGDSTFLCSHDTAWAESIFKTNYLTVFHDWFVESSIEGFVHDNDATDYVWNDSNSLLSERMAFYHVHLMREYITNIDKTYTALDHGCTAMVNQEPECNAYADEYGIEMHQANTGCSDSGWVPTIFYHEYGHFCTFHQYTVECPNDVHEGCSDYFAATVSNQKYIALDWQGRGTYVRRCDIPIQWPAAHCGGEPHCLGQVLATSLWDTRTLLGRDYTDYLFFFARYGNPTTTPDFPPEMIILDDDNDNPLDGSANYSKIKQGFYTMHSVPVPDAPNLPTTGVSVDLWPVKPPVKLNHATGGNVFYKIRLTNLDASTPHQFQIWAAVELPWGGFYGPLLPPSINRHAPLTLSLSGGQSFEMTLRQAIPGNLPVGTYPYHVRIGQFVNHTNDILLDDAWFDLVLE